MPENNIQGVKEKPEPPAIVKELEISPGVVPCVLDMSGPETKTETCPWSKFPAA